MWMFSDHQGNICMFSSILDRKKEHSNFKPHHMGKWITSKKADPQWQYHLNRPLKSWTCCLHVTWVCHLSSSDPTFHNKALPEKSRWKRNLICVYSINVILHNIHKSYWNTYQLNNLRYQLYKYGTNYNTWKYICRWRYPYDSNSIGSMYGIFT